MTKSILVTGGAGYIGSHVALALLDAGHDVHVIDTFETGNEKLVDPRARLYPENIASTDAVKEIMRDNRIDTIIHLAASTRVEESMSDPAKYYANNTVNTLTLINAAAEAGLKHFIFSSTAAVYGIPKDPLVSEDYDVAPISAYGSSKLMAEKILMDCAASKGFDYSILRYFNVAGADPKGRSGPMDKNPSHLVGIACKVATGKLPSMKIFGTDYDTPDGTSIRDYIHVSDLADIHLAILKTPTNSILNCGYGRGYSVREVLSALEKVSGKKLDIQEAGRRPGDTPMVVANAQRLLRETGWKPAHDDLEEIVESAWKWESAAH